MAWLKPQQIPHKILELVLHNRVSFKFDGVPLPRRPLSMKQKLNLCKIGLSYLLRTEQVFGVPPTIQVEPTNVCNLKCPLCPTGIGSMKRKKGRMDLHTFETLIEDIGDVLLTVILYSWGEPFLNKEMIRMIKMCTDRNISTITDSNGHCLQTMEEALAVVDAGLSAAIIALDGSTQEIYRAFRKTGHVEKVKRCIGNLEEAKAKRGKQLPYTCLRTIVTRDNEKDVENLEALAHDLGVNMFSTKTLGMETRSKTFHTYEPVNHGMKRFEYKDTRRLHKEQLRCPFPFRQPTVFWDGTVVGCEYDYDLDIPWGTIGEKPFAEIMNSPQAKKLRRSIQNGTQGSFCNRVCPYQDRVQDRSYLTCKELRPIDS